jgi:hypothetical protein
MFFMIMEILSVSARSENANRHGIHGLHEILMYSFRILQADAELEASKKLADAAQQMANNPVAVELRRMQMVTEVGAENNSTTVLMIPSDFVSLSTSLAEYLRAHKSGDAPSKA